MGNNILVVDDAAFMRMMVKDILTKGGYNVVGEAENGVVAIQKYTELKPDLVTLDITMPDGKVIHITKPTQQMVIRMLHLRDIDESSAPEKIVAAINTMVLQILNSNDGGAVYELAYVEDMSIKMKSAVITAYSEFITGLQSNPN